MEEAETRGRPIGVLVLHPAKYFGGSSQSLLDLLGGLPPGSAQFTAVCPRGPVAERFAAAGWTVVPTRGIPILDHSCHGQYVGLRWLLVLRELLYLPGALWALLRVRRRREAVDLIHANIFSTFLFGIVAKRLLGKPLLVHGRELLEVGRGVRRRRLIEHLVERHVDALVAIDQRVVATLPAGPRTEVIHNSWTPKVFGLEDSSEEGQTVVGMIGVLTPMKGVFDFLRAAAICVERGLAMKFLVAGNNARPETYWTRMLYRLVGKKLDVRSELEEMSRECGLREHLTFCGHVEDIDSWYASIDVLCFPSHLEAVGRPVFEAALQGKPSIVALSAGVDVSDVFVDEATGIRVPPQSPRELADAMEYLHWNPEVRAELGLAARELAVERFDSRTNARRMLKLYCDLVAGT